MKYILTIFLACLTLSVCAQEKVLCEKSKEKRFKIDAPLDLTEAVITKSGYFNEKLHLLIRSYFLKSPEVNSMVLNESSNILSRTNIGFESLLKDYSFMSDFNAKEIFFIFSKAFLRNDSDIGYLKLKLYYKGKEYSLDSIYNIEKEIHTSFSLEKRLLLANSLSHNPDSYNEDQDNRIIVYNLNNIESGEIEKSYIPCDKCSDSHLIGDTLYFTKGRIDGYGGYSNKDIYKSPWSSLGDSIKIASTTYLHAVTPDGKYILGERFFDIQRNTMVIIDVEKKKFQFLLGRGYESQHFFYSYHHQKFATIYKDYVIYFDFPEQYPFDALKWRNEEVPDWTEEEFWKQFQHEDL